MGQLDDKVAIVTGATRGIGRAITEQFLTEGARVASVGRTAVTGLDDDQSSHRHICADVGSEMDWERIIEETLEFFGRVDVLVNNAGQITYQGIEELSSENWEQIIRTNQTGTFLGMRAVIPHMRAKGGGSIINVSSIWGSAAVEGAHAYHASKGAVLMMTRNAAITYAGQGIRVNSLLPGFTTTPLTEIQDGTVNEYVISQTPLGRAGRADEIAAGAVFLASDSSSFMTGADLVIDGGYLAR